jgi:hypothetical protein
MSANNDAIEKLLASTEYSWIRASLQKLSGSTEDELLGLRTLIPRALQGPLPHEKLTKARRLKIGDRIIVLAKELAALLYEIHGDNEHFREWPSEFQAHIDGIALEATLDFRDLAGVAKESEIARALEDDNGAAFHSTRFGIYHALMDCLPEVLETIADAAKWWKEDGAQPLAKPNHKNAKRLYFIRALTAYFFRIYDRPQRELTLRLTSVYFDCGDLEEAALSNLAPITKRMKYLSEMRKKARKTKLSQKSRSL